MRALEALSSGEAALVATDTVYGLAAVPGSAGCERIYELKGRPRSQALPWLVSGVGALARYGHDVPSYAFRLAVKFWPGALTLVVKASEEACKLGGVARDGTLALRCPADVNCLSALSSLGRPLACTSANLHGKPAVREKSSLDSSFRALPGYGELPAACVGGEPSTIVSCLSGSPSLVRGGPVSFEDVCACAAGDATLPV